MEITFKNIAVKSFDFILLQIFNENGIEVISNNQWLQKGEKAASFGEQPIDVAYTIMTHDKFYEAFISLLTKTWESVNDVNISPNCVILSRNRKSNFKKL